MVSLKMSNQGIPALLAAVLRSTVAPFIVFAMRADSANGCSIHGTTSETW